MSDWVFGARFVCPRCRRRSSWRSCSGCGDVAHDLADEADREQLARSWRPWADLCRGRGLGSPLIIPRLRALLVLSALVGVGAALAPVFGPLASGKSFNLPIALLVGVVSFPLATAFFALVLFIYAHVFRLLAGLLGGGVALLRPLGARRMRSELSVLARICRWIAKLLLPQIELERATVKASAAAPGHQQFDAVLEAPLTLHRQQDGGGLIATDDAWIDDGELALRRRDDGQRLLLPLEAGAISIEPELLRRSEVSSGDQGSSEPPAWLALSTRTGRRSSLRLPADAIVTVTTLADGGPVHLAFR
jgi:hypothetical protein